MPSTPVTISQICSDDDAAIGGIIRKVGAEFGAVGEGFGPGDAEVSAMSRHYLPEDGSCYLVAKLNGHVVGGGGIAPFNSDKGICELRKLFLLPESRGYGIGRSLLEQCLDFAVLTGYSACYLDSLRSMETAIKLYERFGFQRLDAPMEGTPHNRCDVWMLKSLLANND
ncbi:GNAT family N-acetyltransferase [Litorivivens sp.]|uniref:GNAT family N-acetyltransferase n=1 Tax=Litorivivens sp. TaxID=2020868 RepID=UPI003569430E